MKDEMVAMESASPYGAIQRRQAGKREWKMSLHEVLESEQASIGILRAIGNKYPTDAETQRLVGQGFAEAAERVIKLNELLRYKGATSEEENRPCENGCA